MMPRFQILHFPGPEMARLPKNLNQKLGFSGKKFRQMSCVKISNLLGTRHVQTLDQNSKVVLFDEIFIIY